MQKIVFNAHYLMYFDTAMADYWRALALPYEEAMLVLGGELYVKKATLEYHGSARLDDQLEVALKCIHIGNSSMVFAGVIFRTDAVLVTCELVYVFADPVSQTSRPVPLALRSLVDRFESAQCVVDAKLGNWAALGMPVTQIRAAVFAQEPSILPDDEHNETDRSALHAVVFNGLGQGIATGRLLTAGNGAGHISLLGVHRAVRGAGIGQGVLERLIQEARERGCFQVVLHAPCSAVDFYQRLGFAACGESFMVAGIRLIKMVKSF